MREPIDFAGAFLLEDADIAPELRIAQWRQAGAGEQRAASQHARRPGRPHVGRDAARAGEELGSRQAVSTRSAPVRRARDGHRDGRVPWAWAG